MWRRKEYIRLKRRKSLLGYYIVSACFYCYVWFKIPIGSFMNFLLLLKFFFVFKFFMRMENFLLCFWNWNFCWEHFRSPEGNLALRSFRSHENLIWKGWKITIIALMIYSKHFCYCLLGNCLFLYEHFTRLGMKFLWKMEFSANN